MSEKKCSARCSHQKRLYIGATRAAAQLTPADESRSRRSRDH